jgi:hypothetical protein
MYKAHFATADGAEFEANLDKLAEELLRLGGSP